MDIRRPTTTTEYRALIGIFQYYREIWPRRPHILAPLTEVDISLKGRKILWNDDLESSFKEIKHMVFAEMLLSYPYWKLPFKVHNNASNKQLGAYISHNNKPIAFF